MPPLVSTREAETLLDDEDVRFVEVGPDTRAYEKGRIPGAVGWSWLDDVQHPILRDVPDAERLSGLLQRSGIRKDTSVILYGDNQNWFASYAYWVLRMHGHDRVRLLDGGRHKWLQERRPTTADATAVEATEYRVSLRHPGYRALREEVVAAARARSVRFLDVRSPAEFAGAVPAVAPGFEGEAPPFGLAGTSLRGGHLPNAVNVPSDRAVDPTTGAYLPREELERLYLGEVGLDRGSEVVVYCRIGARTTHTWFALHEILGLEGARAYDGSWQEYGNLVGVPIEAGRAR